MDQIDLLVRSIDDTRALFERNDAELKSSIEELKQDIKSLEVSYKDLNNQLQNSQRDILNLRTAINRNASKPWLTKPRVALVTVVVGLGTAVVTFLKEFIDKQ